MFEQLCAALKIRVCPEIIHCIEYYFIIQDFEQLATTLETEFALKFFTILNILFHSGY